MAITVSKIFNANIYLDGTVELIGRASEVKLPDIESEMSEHKGLGMVGALELPAGLKAMVMSIKWTGFYADHVKAGANPFKAHAFQIRANHETYNAEGRSTQEALIVSATGSWKKNPLGTFKPMEASSGYDDEIALTYLKVELGGVELLEVDVFENVWRVNGVDVLAEYRASLGG